jgi:hypothetical protein
MRRAHGTKETGHFGVAGEVALNAKRMDTLMQTPLRVSLDTTDWGGP